MITSGCSAAIAAARSTACAAARFPHQRAEPGSSLPVGGCEVGKLRSEQRGIDADAVQKVGLGDTGPDGDAMTSALQLQKRRDERVQPPWNRFDVREERGHRQASGPRESRADPAATWGHLPTASFGSVEAHGPTREDPAGAPSWRRPLRDAAGDWLSAPTTPIEDLGRATLVPPVAPRPSALAVTHRAGAE
jgi:hypothetical protein